MGFRVRTWKQLLVLGFRGSGFGVKGLGFRVLKGEWGQRYEYYDRGL